MSGGQFQACHQVVLSNFETLAKTVVEILAKILVKTLAVFLVLRYQIFRPRTFSM